MFRNINSIVQDLIIFDSNQCVILLRGDGKYTTFALPQTFATYLGFNRNFIVRTGMECRISSGSADKCSPNFYSTGLLENNLSPYLCDTARSHCLFKSSQCAQCSKHLLSDCTPICFVRFIRVVQPLNQRGQVVQTVDQGVSNSCRPGGVHQHQITEKAHDLGSHVVRDVAAHVRPSVTRPDKMDNGRFSLELIELSSINKVSLV